MGGLFSSPADDFISSTLQSSQLVHRHTLSTCYDAIFDVSLSSKNQTILLSDDGRLRSFAIDVENDGQLTEIITSSTKALTHEQIHDIAWSTQLDRFLVLTSKRLTTYDQENNFVDLDLGLSEGALLSHYLSSSHLSLICRLGSPPFWRMACWSAHLVLNLGLGTSVRYHTLPSTSSLSVPLVETYTRSALGYANSDLLSLMALSPQLILAVNAELADNRHVVDLFSIAARTNFQRLKRIHSNEPCPLDVITSLRNYTWLCKSHWPSDDCLCVIQSDGQVKRLPLQEQNGYVVNLRLLADQSHVVIVRTPSKLPKETDVNEQNRNSQEEEEPSTRGRGRQMVGKLPGNLLVEIYKIPNMVQ